MIPWIQPHEEANSELPHDFFLQKYFHTNNKAVFHLVCSSFKIYLGRFVIFLLLSQKFILLLGGGAFEEKKEKHFIALWILHDKNQRLSQTLRRKLNSQIYARENEISKVEPAFKDPGRNYIMTTKHKANTNKNNILHIELCFSKYTNMSLTCSWLHNRTEKKHFELYRVHHLQWVQVNSWYH